MTGKLGCTGFLKFALLNSSSSKKRALKITNLTRVSVVEGLEYRCNINATEWTKHLKRPGPWLKGNMTWSIAYIRTKPTVYFFLLTYLFHFSQFPHRFLIWFDNSKIETWPWVLRTILAYSGGSGLGSTFAFIQRCCHCDDWWRQWQPTHVQSTDVLWQYKRRRLPRLHSC